MRRHAGVDAPGHHCARPGGSIGFVGVPHGVELDGQKLFFSQNNLLGGPAPVRRFLPHLIDLVLTRKINPGKVFDLELPIADVAEGYRAMDERQDQTLFGSEPHARLGLPSDLQHVPQNEPARKIQSWDISEESWRSLSHSPPRRPWHKPAKRRTTRRNLLNGAWRMVSLEAGAPGGALAPVEYTGQIVFTDAGTISSRRSNPAGNSPTIHTIAGYEAFYGQFTVSDDGRTFVIDVDASLVRDMIGQEFERRFEVTDERLVLTPTNPQENWRVVYERY